MPGRSPDLWFHVSFLRTDGSAGRWCPGQTRGLRGGRPGPWLHGRVPGSSRPGPRSSAPPFGSGWHGVRCAIAFSARSRRSLWCSGRGGRPPGGALRADQASRQHVGRLLVGNSRVTAPPAARQQLAAGQIDTRLLITIGTLSHQGMVRIVSFGDSGPGASAGVPLRAVEIASAPGDKSGYLQSVLALLRAQRPPYLASTTLTRLADGQQVVQIVFDAPSPPALLSR